MTALAYETYHLGLRTTRRFIRVPANVISILFFPIIQLVVFSQLYEDIIQLPGFEGDVSYLAYLAPGQIAFTAFFAVAWAGFGLLMEIRSGYTDKLRASPIHRWSILASEMVPLFFQAAAMAAIILAICILLGTPIETGIPGILIILTLSGLFGLAISGASFIPALITKSEQATSTFSLLLFPFDVRVHGLRAGGAHARMAAVREPDQPDQLRDRGHSSADGDRVRLEPDRPGVAVDPDHGCRAPGRHPVGVQPGLALSRGASPST